MDKNHKIELLTFLLILLIFISVVIWYNDRKELEKARSVTVEQLMAEKYCVSLKYDKDTWEEEFKACLEYAEQHPLEIAQKMFNY